MQCFVSECVRSTEGGKRVFVWWAPEYVPKLRVTSSSSCRPDACFGTRAMSSTTQNVLRGGGCVRLGLGCWGMFSAGGALAGRGVWVGTLEPAFDGGDGLEVANVVAELFVIVMFAATAMQPWVTLCALVPTPEIGTCYLSQSYRCVQQANTPLSWPPFLRA